MRCLFVMDDHPVSPDAPGGGPPVMYSHLELLAHWGAEIHLLLLRHPARSFGFEEYVEAQPETWSLVRGWCASHAILDLRGSTLRGGVAAAGKRFVSAVRDPYSQFPIAQDRGNAKAFARIVDSLEPDLVWAENVNPAMIARRASGRVPMVYGHHDWIWRILQLNEASGMRGVRGHVNGRLFRRAEELLVREVAGCVSPSAREAEELRRLNDHVAYLPPTYPPHEGDLPGTVPLPPRIVHLGGMRTVASRVGLQRFLDAVWPFVRAAVDPAPELVVVGSLDGASEALRMRLHEAGASCAGFVRDLGSVLRPYDVHVIPWEHRTGARTRVPLAMRHAQVVVSTQAAVDGLTGLADGENCVLVEDLDRMADAIRPLLEDGERRRELGRAARSTFDAHFTREDVQPRFDGFMKGIGTALHAFDRGG